MFIKKYRKKDLRSSGASYVEFAIVIPVLLFVTLFIIDISRYVFTLSVLNTAAAIGVDYAAKLDIGTYIDQGYCTSNPKALAECNKYIARVNAINTRALNIAKLAASTDQNAYTHLLQQTMYSTEGYASYQPIDSTVAPISSSVGFLRPGETNKIIWNNTFFDHPTLLPKRTGGVGMPTKTTIGGWDQVFLQHPIAVNIQAQMRCFTPLFGPWLVQATQLAYKKPLSKSISGSPADINPLTPTATPSRTPTATPTGGGPIGNTPVPATPYPTATPAPMPNCGSSLCSLPCQCQFLQCYRCPGITCPACND
jgi:hypothetical protein